MEISQALVHHFWQCWWSVNYVVQLRKCTKWKFPSKNSKVGDLVCLQDEGVVPTKWPLTWVTAVHPGKHHLVLVITLQMSRGPITKVVLILRIDAWTHVSFLFDVSPFGHGWRYVAYYSHVWFHASSVMKKIIVVKMTWWKDGCMLVALEVYPFWSLRSFKTQHSTQYLSHVLASGNNTG